jgi:hypothetical protein
MTAAAEAFPKTPRRRSGRWRRPAALAASVLLHALAVYLALNSAAGSWSGGAGAAGADGDAVTVSLVRGDGLTGADAGALSAKARADANALDRLMQKIRADAPNALPASAPQGKTGSAAALLDEIARAHAAQGKDKTGEAPASGAPRPSGPAGQKAAASDHGAQQGAQGQAEGELWGQIQICWKPTAAVPVVLEVVIDSSGRLAAPPAILRPAGAALDEKRLKAEASAVQAVAACAPFRSGAPLFGKRTYRFAFAPGDAARKKTA